MKIALSILGLALFSLFNAQAQVVTVQVTLEQEQFLPGESLPATVHIVNNSGQSLHLGADADWLTFTVESVDNDFVVMKNADPPVVGEFDLGSSEVATKRMDLAPYFDDDPCGTLSRGRVGSHPGMEHGCKKPGEGVRHH